MYQILQRHIQEDMILSDVIMENPSLLLMLQFFEINDAISNKSIRQICKQKNINPSLLLLLANLYNGNIPIKEDFSFEDMDVTSIISFLKNAHEFYLTDKYPEIQKNIRNLHEKSTYNESMQIQQIELFFQQYFKEVMLHLRYEEEHAFPYFSQLVSSDSQMLIKDFSVNEYRDHHSDIETKLSDLKNLLVRHVSLESNFPLKRKIIKSVFELEKELKIHSQIEELILLPLLDHIENQICLNR
jgi:regulator of cell morphogenesis and NO signaling